MIGLVERATLLSANGEGARENQKEGGELREREREREKEGTKRGGKRGERKREEEKEKERRERESRFRENVDN